MLKYFKLIYFSFRELILAFPLESLSGVDIGPRRSSWLGPPVHPGGVSVEGRVPLHGEELHPADGVVVLGRLEVALQ